MASGERGVGVALEQEKGEVQPVELFFDLVYVLAVTQLTHYLLDHLPARGGAETLLLLLAVWGAWIHPTWMANSFDRSTRSVRLMLIGVMLASLMLSSSVPEAVRERGLVFAMALVAILAGGTMLVLAAIGRSHHLSGVFERVLIWWSVIGVIRFAGGLMRGGVRVGVWLVAGALISWCVMAHLPPLLESMSAMNGTAVLNAGRHSIADAPRGGDVVGVPAAGSGELPDLRLSRSRARTSRSACGCS
jgi:low temperature requirement protein LtrA